MDDPLWQADRPHMPGYGLMSAEAGAGLLSWDQLATWFASARNYWVVVVTPDGRPHATPVWGLWHGGQFYFSSGEQSRKAASLRLNPAIVVHLESGDEVAILEGMAVVLEDKALLAELGEAYLAKYGVGLQASPVYRVDASRAFAWREADFPGSATRWTLGKS